MPVDALTYRDVQIVLALVDSWRQGHAYFADGRLTVEASLDAPLESGLVPQPASARVMVRAPTVGVFQPAPAAPSGTGYEGNTVANDTVIGVIVAPGRTTPVEAGVHGRITELNVAPGQFVEYGQVLMTLSALDE